MEPNEPEPGQPLPSAGQQREPSPQPPRYGLGERIKKAFGNFFGSGGPRAGHRDPDPGHK